MLERERETEEMSVNVDIQLLLLLYRFLGKLSYFVKSFVIGPVDTITTCVKHLFWLVLILRSSSLLMFSFVSLNDVCLVANLAN